MAQANTETSMDLQQQNPAPDPQIAPSFGSEANLVPDSPLQHLISSCFLNPQGGLRSAWRIVLYLIISLAIFLVGYLLLQLFPSPPRFGQLIRLVAAEIVLMASALLSAAVMARVENRRWGAYGLPFNHGFGRLFWVGTAWGIISLSLLIAALHGAGVFDFGSITLHGARVAKFALFWAMFFLIVGFFEEFLMRGYTQFTLSQAVGFWPAAVLLSLAFGTIHLGNQGEGMVGALAAAAIGFFFCLTLRRTGNLWFAVGFHMSWDWGETFLYSVPNSGNVMPGHLLSSSFHGAPWLSGGTVGPEGSVLAFVTVGLLWVVFDRVYPEKKFETGSEESHVPVPNPTS